MFHGDQNKGLAFGGSSSHQGGRLGVVLYNPNGTHVSLSFRPDFPCSNNEAEYETLVIGLVSALRMRIQKL